eukprot:TRINITY_DN15152_c0_g1_i1.p1 TRINITY_DN15152_c0_g1~~TRINITY_DN15152_c0_g1_i1.p1  ORF type:complete len:254 (+),score=33.48 TRINITY_DN15152_c0_g1_i1:111-872(+)
MHGVRLLRDVIRLTCKESGFGIGVYTAAENNSCSGDLTDQMSFISKWIMAVGAALGTQLACDARIIATSEECEHLNWLIRCTIRAAHMTTGINIEEKVNSLIELNRTYTMATLPLEGTNGLIPIESIERAAVESEAIRFYVVLKSNLRHILFISSDDISDAKSDLFAASAIRVLGESESAKRTSIVETQWTARNVLQGQLHAQRAVPSRSVELAILAAAIKQNRIPKAALRAAFLHDNDTDSIDVSSSYSTCT